MKQDENRQSMNKILVVDDIPTNLILIETVLKKYLPDYQILLANSGKECLELASAEQPDTILLDVLMPELDGYEVCRLLKNNPVTSAIPVLMVSAYGGNPEFRVNGLKMGADGFISKPFDHAELIALIHVMLRIKKAEDTLKRQNKDLETLIARQLNEFSKSEQRLFQISDFVNEFFWETDETLGFTYVSPSIENILGYSAEKLRSVFHLYDVVDPVFQDEIRHHMLLVVANAESFNRKQLQCKHQDGSIIWLMLSGFPLFSPVGELLGYRGVYQNITQRIRDEEKHTMVINTSLDGFILTNASNSIVEVNDAYCKLSGYSRQELVGKNYSDIDQNDPDSLASEDASEQHKTGYSRYESKHNTKNKKAIDVEVSIKFINLIEYQKFIFVRDISDRKLVEAEKTRNLEVIQNYQKNLKNLHHRLITAEEKERKRMAEFLHDGIGQNLSIAYLKLSSVSDYCTGKTQKVIRDTLTVIDTSIKETRLLTYDLSPTVLYELGLLSAIRWKLDQLKDEFKLNSSLLCPVRSIVVSNETAILLYRMVAELLANIIKHAKASLVSIEVAILNNTLSISISDNGAGFDQQDILKKPNGFGLFNIRERIESIQGNLVIRSAPQKGTTIVLHIPYSHHEN